MKLISTIAGCILSALLIVSLLVIGRQFFDSRRNQQASHEAAELAGVSEDPTEAVEFAPTPAPAEEKVQEPLPDEAAHLGSLQLETLKEVNKDVVGWIEIPGTEISYPLLQGEDNRYYLTHDWRGEANTSGSVFLESTNVSDFTDYHTIAYAHRMRNDTMFGSLKYYEDPAYWQRHPKVYIATGTAIFEYEIFSSQEAAPEDIIYRLDIAESGCREEFLDYCVEGSKIETGIIPEISSRILTLSTCTGRSHSSRFVVHAVLKNVWTTD